MEYAIIKHVSCAEMAKHINSLMAEGWEPQGGICYTGDEYVQAVRWVSKAVQVVPAPA